MGLLGRLNRLAIRAAWAAVVVPLGWVERGILALRRWVRPGGDEEA
jgi:hypothetical protein